MARNCAWVREFYKAFGLDTALLAMFEMMMLHVFFLLFYGEGA